MKCAKCGKEFGDGNTCINCGADRVSAFGEFQGFGIDGSNASKPTYDGGQRSPASGYAICYHCGTIIPSSSKFCPQCKTQLLIECPQCKHICSTQYPACPNCGVDRDEYMERLREVYRKRAEQEHRDREEREKQERIEWNRKNKRQEKLIPVFIIVIALVLGLIANKLNINIF